MGLIWNNHCSQASDGTRGWEHKCVLTLCSTFDSTHPIRPPSHAGPLPLHWVCGAKFNSPHTGAWRADTMTIWWSIYPVQMNPGLGVFTWERPKSVVSGEKRLFFRHLNKVSAAQSSCWEGRIFLQSIRLLLFWKRFLFICFRFEMFLSWKISQPQWYLGNFIHPNPFELEPHCSRHRNQPSACSLSNRMTVRQPQFTLFFTWLFDYSLRLVSNCNVG